MDIYEKAKQIIYKHYDVGGARVHPIYKDAAYDCVVAAIKQTTDEACKWLSSHFWDDKYQLRSNEGWWTDADTMIGDFKKAMEE